MRVDVNIQSNTVFVYTVKNIGKFPYRKWKYFIDLRKIDRILRLISELLGNILKR